jgi:hypothetical protein
MRAQAGLWPKAIAHNSGHYVTLPPDKTMPNVETAQDYQAVRN